MLRLSIQSLRTISSLRKTDLKTHLKLFKSTATRAASSDQTLVAAAEYCRKCGSIVERIIPEGDFRLRAVCSSPGCGFIEYSNPRIVTGAIIDHQGKILLARRGINPQKGLWTVPAGFLELGESSADGAVRETLEETGANVAIIAPYCHYDIVGISQAYTLFRAKLLAPYTFKAVLPESLEVKLFAPTEIPFEELAFSSVSIALKAYLRDMERGSFGFYHGSIVKEPGSGPNDPGTFKLTDLYSVNSG